MKKKDSVALFGGAIIQLICSGKPLTTCFLYNIHNLSGIALQYLITGSSTHAKNQEPEANDEQNSERSTNKKNKLR